MESLSGSLFISNLSETHPFLNTHLLPSSSSSSCLIKAPNKRIETLKFNSEASHFHGFRLQALSHEVPGEGEDQPQPRTLNVGFSLASEDSLSVSQGDSDENQSSEKDADKLRKVETKVEIQFESSVTAPHASGVAGGTRAGLFRTPISGGVQSATSAHGLPRPALAVRNLMEQIPGWSGLSNARVTIFGDVYPLPEHQQEWAHKQYVAKHQQVASQQWGNFYYFRMQNISDIYFIGGFGTVAWVNVKEYEELKPDKTAVDGGEQNLKELNATFSKPLRKLLSTEAEVDDAALISIDSKGIDIRVRQGAQFNIQRSSFEEGKAVETLEEAKAALWNVIKKGRVQNLKK